MQVPFHDRNRSIFCRSKSWDCVLMLFDFILNIATWCGCRDSLQDHSEIAVGYKFIGLKVDILWLLIWISITIGNCTGNVIYPQMQIHMVNEQYQQTIDSRGDWLVRGWRHSVFEAGTYLHLLGVYTDPGCYWSRQLRVFQHLMSLLF